MTEQAISQSVRILDSDVLIVVDPQVDFCPGGALAVAGGDEIFDAVNKAMPRFNRVIATQDWHPREHKYFSAQGGPWPFHCIQGTAGAEFHPKLDRSCIHEIVRKGTDPELDGYSAFAGTGLAARLRQRGLTRVFIAGLATDYCVKATAIEAVEYGFETYVLADAIRAVELAPGDGDRALAAMRQAGVRLISSLALAETNP
jgi:nicotinamidase/pyrazinamidase